MANSITMAELQHDARRILDHLQRKGEPLLVTQRGRGRAFLVPVETHERQRQETERLRVVALVEAGRRAVAEGRTHSSEEVRRAFENRGKKRGKRRR